MGTASTVERKQHLLACINLPPLPVLLLLAEDTTYYMLARYTYMLRVFAHAYTSLMLEFTFTSNILHASKVYIHASRV